MTNTLLLQANALEIPLPDESVHCVVTSPPYWALRDYGLPPLVWDGEAGCAHVWGEGVTAGEGYASGSRRRWQHGATRDDTPDEWQPETGQGQFCRRCGAWRGCLGLEPTPELYVAHLAQIFREVRRVLRADGTLWLNLGDSYAASTVSSGLKPKDMVGIPWRVAFALQADGWWLRADVVWHKPNCMPESVTDRPTKAHEYLFLLAKSRQYFYDAEAVKEKSSTPAGLPWEQRKTMPPGKSAGIAWRRDVSVAAAGTLGDGITRNKRSVWTIPTQPFGWTETVHLVRVELGDVSDGTIYIASPGCPVHGYLGSQDGECVGGESSRNQHSDHHERLPLSAPVSSSRHPVLCCSRYSLDSPGLASSHAAIEHSKQIHKTGHVPVTNLSCTLCAETCGHIDDKSVSPVCAVLRERMSDCNTWPDEMDARLLDQIPHRIVGKLSSSVPPECQCGFYHRVTRKSSHFATFPLALVEPCIKAGTSERGVCPRCGAPWERVVEKKKASFTNARPFSKPGCENSRNDVGRIYEESVLKTIGWQPTCACEAGDPTPATVLDPFCGTGTTLLVARALGRRGVGLDLSFDYLRDQARERLELRALEEWQNGEQVEAAWHDLPLFEGMTW